MVMQLALRLLFHGYFNVLKKKKLLLSLMTLIITNAKCEKLTSGDTFALIAVRIFTCVPMYLCLSVLQFSVPRSREFE